MVTFDRIRFHPRPSGHPMIRLAKSLSLAGAAALVVAACAGDPAAPSAESPFLSARMSADLAQIAADGVAGDVEAMRGLNLDIRMGFGLFLAPDAAPGDGARACPFDAASGYHVCAEVVTDNGFVFNRRYGFFDAAGKGMEAYDAEQTARIHVVKSAKGSVERTSDEGTRWTASLERSRDQSVSGLQGTEQQRTWNGDGLTKVSRARFPAGASASDRSYDLTATVAVADVVVPTRNNDALDPWPLSGTITKVMQGTVKFTKDGVAETRTIDRRVVVTFNGTQFATATVTGPNGTETFEIDLANRRADRRGGGSDRRP